MRHGGTAHVAANFTITGGLEDEPPPFSFADEFDSLKLLSESWADLHQTAGASVVVNQGSHELDLTGTGNGLNVFTVNPAELAEAQGHGIVVNLTQTGATALINVTTDTDLAVSIQYMRLLDSASAATVAWNLPLATSLRISGSVDWRGRVLAPNAAVREETSGQFHGQLIADSIPAFNRDSTRVAFTGCLPPPRSATISARSTCRPDMMSSSMSEVPRPAA